MQNSEIFTTIKQMYQSINWAMRNNAQNNFTDLKGNYLNELQELDENELWQEIEEFYVSLMEMQGWEYTHDMFSLTMTKYPSITKFLTVCVYS